MARRAKWHSPKHLKLLVEHFGARYETVLTEGDESCIYLIKINEFYKIGRAKNVYKRLGQMQVGNPYQIEFICLSLFKNSKIAEDTLHSMLRDLRIRGEWFELNSLALKFVKKVLKTYGQNPIHKH